MGVERLVALLRLARADTALLVFLTLFFPIYFNSGSAQHSLAIAVPGTIIAMLTFIINDYNDADSDRANHPTRPIPSGQITRATSIGFYFLLLFTSLAAIYYVEDAVLVWLLFFFLVIAINYNYVKDEFPALKAPYVSACAILPIFIIMAAIGKYDPPRLTMAASLFCSCMAREILMDVADMKGDAATLPNLIGSTRATALADYFQAFGLVLLLWAPKTTEDYLVLVGIVGVSIYGRLLWRRPMLRERAIMCLKIPMFFGIYYLI